MKKMVFGAATALAVTLSPSPCRAADDMPIVHNSGRQTSAFAGANIRLGLDRRGQVKPTARLQFGMMGQQGVEPLSPSSRSAVHGLELGLTRGGHPELYLGGQTTGQIRDRLKLNGSPSNTVAIILGVALVAVGIIVISNLNDLDDAVPEFQN